MHCRRGIQYEPDPVHAEALFRELGLQDANTVATPWAADSGSPDDSSRAALNELRRQVGSQRELDPYIATEEIDVFEESLCLNAELKSKYQSLAARTCFLSLDRTDIQFPAKELMRHMSDPRE